MTYLTALCQESPPAQKKLPNYDFSIDNLEVFFPNSTQEEIEKKVGKGSIIGGNVWLTHSVPPNSRVFLKDADSVQEERVKAS